MNEASAVDLLSRPGTFDASLVDLARPTNPSDTFDDDMDLWRKKLNTKIRSWLLQFKFNRVSLHRRPKTIDLIGTVEMGDYRGDVLGRLAELEMRIEVQVVGSCIYIYFIIVQFVILCMNSLQIRLYVISSP